MPHKRREGDTNTTDPTPSGARPLRGQVFASPIFPQSNPQLTVVSDAAGQTAVLVHIASILFLHDMLEKQGLPDEETPFSAS